jgi:hypothetical protein
MVGTATRLDRAIETNWSVQYVPVTVSLQAQRAQMVAGTSLPASRS